MTFIEFYNLRKKEFEDSQLFTMILGEQRKIQWPTSSGVYAIWRKTQSNNKTLIYIGMTGKYSRNSTGKIDFNRQSFKERTQRWTPYRFCEGKKDIEMKYFFRYNPKYSKTSIQAKNKYNFDAYRDSIAYQELEIHCFHINSDHDLYSPILMESELLTSYLKSYNDLPPANRSL